MKCESDARRGYRLRHKGRSIGHIQSPCNSRGLACGQCDPPPTLKTGVRRGTVGRNDIRSVLLSPGTPLIDSLTRRPTHGALHDKPFAVIGRCGGVLQRGVVTPGQIDYARGISGLRVVKDLGRIRWNHGALHGKPLAVIGSGTLQRDLAPDGVRSVGGEECGVDDAT